MPLKGQHISLPGVYGERIQEVYNGAREQRSQFSVVRRYVNTLSNICLLKSV